jgi:site-specific recombinase XerD
MNKQLQDFNQLTSDTAEYLRSVHRFSTWTIGHYKQGWRIIREYLVTEGIRHYSPSIGKKILKAKFNDRSISDLSSWEKQIYNSIVRLSEFQVSGKIDLRPLMKRRQFIFRGPLGKSISVFIDHKAVNERLSLVRIWSYQRHLHAFYKYCRNRGVHSVSKIDLSFVLQFIRQLDSRKGHPVYETISILRGFIKYAYELKLMKVDLSDRIPKYRSISQSKLPSTYSGDEITQLIKSVDRSSSIGKRDYAVILLAARLGLRASDISQLKFENLNWKNSSVELVQAKTGKSLALPLLADVGNAIIDYLKYGRPKSEEAFIFLTERPPFGHFQTSNVVTHIVQRAFTKAGININGRRFGPHALRHSLGFRMLQESTILPVISEVFGHKSTESTRYYLRIDLHSMQQCMLDVPPINENFYLQKGGVFYEQPV